ncbi:MAG: hypothetical protein ACK5IJ_07000 [Mangrovibacterium sp.]
MYFIILIALVIYVWFLFRKTISKYFKFTLSGKTSNITTIFFVVFGIFCSLLYLKYDSKGYEYGLGCNFCNRKLPYNIVPVSNSQYPQRFYLKDNDDFELVGIGFSYRKNSFKINDFLGYGYNDTSIIVKCTDSLNNIKYLTSYETKYKSKKGNPEISFKDLSNSDFEKVKDKYSWVLFNNEEAQKVTFKRFLSFLGALLSLILIVWRLFKLRSKKATD